MAGPSTHLWGGEWVRIRGMNRETNRSGFFHQPASHHNPLRPSIHPSINQNMTLTHQRKRLRDGSDSVELPKGRRRVTRTPSSCLPNGFSASTPPW